MGHVLSTVKLALALRRRGYQICYFGAPGVERLITRQGFEFYPISEFSIDTTETTNRSVASLKNSELQFKRLVKGNLLDDLILGLRPDIVLINSLYTLEALAVRYRYRVPVVLFTPYLPRTGRRARTRGRALGRLVEMRTGAYDLVEIIRQAGVRFTGLEAIVELTLQIPELVFLPPEFDVEGDASAPNLYHVGPQVELERQEDEFDWTSYDSRPIAFASLGSQSHRKQHLSRPFFEAVIKAFELMPHWQLILSVGQEAGAAELGPSKTNIHVTKVVPQLAVLSRSQIMITHAGIGSVKECIMMTVPMLLFPLMRDQFECASRVSQRGLGIVGNLATVSHTEVMSLTTKLMEDPLVKRNIEEMCQRFIESENVPLAVRIIEETLLSAAAKNT
jgi:MGT family glycosyltransferase